MNALEQLHAQMLNAQKRQAAFMAYAESIGCKFGTGAMYDCIEVTEEQAEQLEAWWEQNHD